MQVTVDLRSAAEHAPEAVADALSELNRKLRRQGGPVSCEDCVWTYSYSLGFRQGLDRGHDVRASLVASFGRSTGRAPLGQGETLRSEAIPPEIAAAIDPPLVTPENTEHILRTMFRTAMHGEVGLLVTGAYRKGDEIFFLGLTEEQPVMDRTCPSVYAGCVGALRLAGGLTRTAQERYDTTPEGGCFQHGRSTLHRLTSREILAVFEIRADPDDAPEPF